MYASALVALVVALLYGAMLAIFRWYILLASVWERHSDSPGALKVRGRCRHRNRVTAEVNGKVFCVNNVSMGVYVSSSRLTIGTPIQAVRRRVAGLLGPGDATQLAVHAPWPRQPSAPRACSWCPTILTRRGGAGLRQRLDGGTLGLRAGRSHEELAALKVVGQVQRLLRGVSGRARGSKCVTANPWRSTARPESSSHRCDWSAGRRCAPRAPH